MAEDKSYLLPLQEAAQAWNACLECPHTYNGCNACEQKNNECAKKVIAILHLHFDHLLNEAKNGFKEGADIKEMEKIIDWVAHRVTQNQSEINELKQILTCDLAQYQTQIMVKAYQQSSHNKFYNNQIPELSLEDQLQLITVEDEGDEDIGSEDSDVEHDEKQDDNEVMSYLMKDVF